MTYNLIIYSQLYVRISIYKHGDNEVKFVFNDYRLNDNLNTKLSSEYTSGYIAQNICDMVVNEYLESISNGPDGYEILTTAINELSANTIDKYRLEAIDKVIPKILNTYLDILETTTTKFKSKNDIISISHTQISDGILDSELSTFEFSIKISTSHMMNEISGYLQKYFPACK